MVNSQHASQSCLMLILHYLCLPPYTGNHYNWKSYLILRRLITQLMDHGISASTCCPKPAGELQLLISTVSIDSVNEEARQSSLISKEPWKPSNSICFGLSENIKMYFLLLAWYVLPCDPAKYSPPVGFGNYFLSFKFDHFCPLHCWMPWLRL